MLLLRTKTTIPPLRPRQVNRDRLFSRVQAGARRALTLIVAPAGFGKSTLAAAWAQTAQMPVAWLSLQPGDRARERFLTYLIQALQTISPEIGQTTLALLQGGSPEGALFTLVNDLAGVEQDFALVLDDYHTIDGPEVNEIIQFLLENRPGSFHLVLASRAAPALALARLRAQDQVAEIIAADLRFTAPEVRAFIETSMELRLPEDELDRLNRSSEGWAVGLQLAALALARGPEALASSAGQERIFDYLAEEVLRREPPAVRAFLKVSALFDRFCAPLCGSVLAAPGVPIETALAETQSALAHIERANLFLTPLGAGWYRYHALFADFLREQTPPAQAAVYYRAASAWLEQNDLLDEAIHYAIHARDFERAADQIERHYIDMLQRGEHSALTGWIEELPPEVSARRPGLWLARGWASVIMLESFKGLECLEKAAPLIPAGPSGARLRGELHSLRILVEVFSGKVADDSQLQAALEAATEQDDILHHAPHPEHEEGCLAADPSGGVPLAAGTLARDDFLHSLLHFNLGLNYVMRGETALAIETFSEAARLTKKLNNPLVAIVTLVQLGETRQLRGALGLAERAFQEAIRYAKETLGERTLLLGMPYVSYAELLREQNRFEEAIGYVEKGIAYCQAWQPLTGMDGHLAYSRLLAAQGKWEQAFAQLESSLRLAEDSDSVLDDTFVANHLARLALLQGDTQRANRLIQMYDLESASHKMVYYLYESTQLVLLRARVMALESDPSPAGDVIQALNALLEGARAHERVTQQIETLLLRAYAHQAAARLADALDDLSQALSLGAQSGYARLFADEGARLLRLLEAHPARIRAPKPYLEMLLKIMRAETQRPSLPAAPAKGALTPLTRRELDILALLAVGKSNQEIADERVLTLNTVKKHVANILSKLGVVNRTQAVLLARKAGWIE